MPTGPIGAGQRTKWVLVERSDGTTSWRRESAKGASQQAGRGPTGLPPNPLLAGAPAGTSVPPALVRGQYGPFPSRGPAPAGVQGPAPQTAAFSAVTNAPVPQGWNPEVYDAVMEGLIANGYGPTGTEFDPKKEGFWAGYSPEQLQVAHAHLERLMNEQLGVLSNLHGRGGLNSLLTTAGTLAGNREALNQFQIQLAQAWQSILKAVGHMIKDAASAH